MAKDINNVAQIQDFLMREMRRLDDNTHMNYNAKDEVARSNALAQSANTFIKSVNLNLRILEVASKNNQTADELSRELGIKENGK